LLDAVFAEAARRGLIDESPEVSIDATGLESRHVSRYYVKRAGSKRFLRYSWPELTVVCHGATHLWAAAVVSDGPSQDSPEFPEAMRRACRSMPIDRLLADAGYDAEHNHTLAREELGVGSTVINRNPRSSGKKWPASKYRRQMKRRFQRRVYGQRWQIESSISRHKRRLGPALRARAPGPPRLRARRDSAQRRECLLRVLTHNLMILRAIQRISTEH
jgi:Transposase DDE domain